MRKHGLLPYVRKLKQRNLQFRPSSAIIEVYKGIPDFENYIKLSKQSMITLGVNRFPSYYYPLHTPPTFVRLRDLEAPMLGACYLTEYSEGIEKMYEMGNDIEIYKNVDEMAEKITMLKNNPTKRKQLRVNGQKKASTELNVAKSIQALLQRIA